jgi:hypothetical protein
LEIRKKYEKQDQQGSAAFKERNPNTTQQHRTTGKEPSRTQIKQDRAQSTDKVITIIIYNRK